MFSTHADVTVRRGPKSWRRILAICAAGLGLAASASAAIAQSVTIDVPAPRQAEWTQTVLRHEGDATVRATTLNAAFREVFLWRIEFILPDTTVQGSSSNDSLALIYAPQNYDPALLGAVDHIDVSMNLLGVFSSFASGSTGSIRPIVQQDGQIYSVQGSSISIFTNNTPPTTWSLLASDNWVRIDGSGGLDLSAAGSPIRFGLRWDLGTICNGVNGCTRAGTILTADALLFEIHPVAAAVPEPATWGMLLAGVLVMGSIVKRKAGVPPG